MYKINDIFKNFKLSDLLIIFLLMPPFLITNFVGKYENYSYFIFSDYKKNDLNTLIFIGTDTKVNDLDILFSNNTESNVRLSQNFDSFFIDASSYSSIMLPLLANSITILSIDNLSLQSLKDRNNFVKQGLTIENNKNFLRVITLVYLNSFYGSMPFIFISILFPIFSFYVIKRFGYHNG